MSTVPTHESKPKQLRPDLQEIVNDMLALRALAKSGILTHYSQRDLLKPLNSRDMANVARAIETAEKQQAAAK